MRRWDLPGRHHDQHPMMSPQYGPGSRRTHTKDIVVGLWARVAATRCWNLWRGYACRRKAARKNHAEISRGQRILLLGQMLSGWRKYARGRKLADQALLGLFLKCMRQSLRAWSLLTWVTNARRAWLQQKFSGWFEHTAFERKLRVLAVSVDNNNEKLFALGVQSRQHQLSAFTRWQRCQEHKRFQRATQRNCTRIKRMTSKRFLDIFRKFVVRRRLLKKRMYGRILGFIQTFLHLALARWFTTARQRKRLKANTLKVLRRLMRRALVESFERWRESVVEERQMKAKARKVVRRLMNRALVEGFERWRDNAQDVLRLRAIVCSACLLWEKSRKREAWMTWSEGHLRLVHARKLRDRIVRRWMHAGLVWALRGWKIDSKRSRWLMQTMDRMLGQSKNRSLTAGFGVMKERATLLSGIMRMANKAHAKALRISQHRGVSRGFLEWRANTSRQRRLRIAGNRILRRRRNLTVGPALLRWARCARERKRHARVAEHVVLRKRLKYFRNKIVFISWTSLACARHLQLQSVLKTVAARSTRITIDILHVWRRWLAEKKHRQALWVVINNKRGTKLTRSTMNQWQSLMAQERMLQNKAILLVSHSLQRQQAEALLHHPSRFTPSSRPPSVCSSAHETQVCTICVPLVFGHYRRFFGSGAYMSVLIKRLAVFLQRQAGRQEGQQEQREQQP
jgi:hypothetical protein